MRPTQQLSSSSPPRSREDSWEVIPFPSSPTSTTLATTSEILIPPPKSLRYTPPPYASSPMLHMRTPQTASSSSLLSDESLEEIHLKELKTLRGHISRLTAQLASSKTRIESLELLLSKGSSIPVEEEEDFSDLAMLAKLGFKATLGLVVFQLVRRRLASPTSVLAGLVAMFGVITV